MYNNLQLACCLASLIWSARVTCHWWLGQTARTSTKHQALPGCRELSMHRPSGNAMAISSLLQSGILSSLPSLLHQGFYQVCNQIIHLSSHVIINRRVKTFGFQLSLPSNCQLGVAIPKIEPGSIPLRVFNSQRCHHVCLQWMHQIASQELNAALDLNTNGISGSIGWAFSLPSNIPSDTLIHVH